MGIFFDNVTVYEFQRGLRYEEGRFVGVVGPGRYRVNRRTTRIDAVDVRPTSVTVPGQEILTQDGVTIRVSVALTYTIVDPATAVHGVDDFRSVVYLAVQVALRDAVAALPVDEVVARRAELGPQLLAVAAPKGAEVGLEVTAAEVKDLMFPGDMRRMMAAVVVARKEGQAALERARGETAALRNLANAARMMEQSPALMQLRLLQELAASSGNTIVLGVPGATPVPLDRGRGDELPPPDVEHDG